MQVPFLGVTLPGSSADWKYESVPQEALANRSIACARGKVLGGSSRISKCMYIRISIGGN